MDLYNLVVAGKVAGGGGGGDEPVLINKNIDANGTYNASSDSADGYKKVVVSVPQPSGSINITQNGTTDVTNYASAVVNVPSVSPTGNINITSMAQTDVSAYATAQVVDADLVAGNIKKDVNILGVTGTYEGGGGGAFDALAYFSGTITKVEIPEGVTHPKRYIVQECSPQVVDFPSTTEAIKSYTIYGTNTSNSPHTVIVRAVTPPTAEDNFFRLSSGSVQEILVPSASVDAYKSASKWSSFADKIQAIPE